jgi:hypothetical protein
MGVTVLRGGALVVKLVLHLLATLLLVRRRGQLTLDWGLAFAAILLLAIVGLISFNPEVRVLFTEAARR